MLEIFLHRIGGIFNWQRSLFFIYIYRNQENDGLTLLSRRGDTTS